MPNWAFGDMVLTGKMSSLLKFLTDSFDVVEITTSDEFDGFYASVRMNGTEDSLHLIGTNRCFVDELKMSIEPINDDWDVRCFIYIHCAWDIDVEGFARISKDYNLAMEAYVEEGGCGFTHRFECNNGEVIKDEFGDYPYSDKEDE